MAVVCVFISFAAFPLWLMTEWLASSLLTNSHPSSGFQPLRGLCVYAEIGTGPCALCTFITMKSIPCLCLLPISLSLYIACRFGRRVNVHATCLPLFRFFTVLFFFFFYFFFSLFSSRFCSCATTWRITTVVNISFILYILYQGDLVSASRRTTLTYVRVSWLIQELKKNGIKESGRNWNRHRYSIYFVRSILRLADFSDGENTQWLLNRVIIASYSPICFFLATALPTGIGLSESVKYRLSCAGAAAHRDNTRKIWITKK